MLLQPRRLVPGMVKQPLVVSSSVPDPLLWLDFSDNTTTFQDSAKTTPATTNGAAVGGVEDKGTVNATIGASGAARPTLVTNAQNSLNGVQFGASQQFDVAGYTLAAAEHYICVVVVANGDITNAAYYFDSETGRFVIGHVSGNTNSVVGFNYGGTWRDIAATTSGAQLLEFILINGTNTAMVYRNGAQIGSNVTYANTAIGGNVAIGSRYSEDSAKLDAILCEYRDYSPMPTSGERSTIRTALGTKWGISV